MDRRQAADYLDRMFGKGKGYISVAYKDPDDSWQEHQFQWPEDRSKILGWARVHADANLFICPSLRQDAHTRKKGDGIRMRWLWADVDWDKVPKAKRALVQKRIEQIGTYVVASGTGDNAHVYVKLTRAVDWKEHFRLNTGLRDYLYADNKQADNSLLRLPGSTNWKDPEGTDVAVQGGNGKSRAPETLLKLRAFSSVRVMAEAVDSSIDWNPVDLPKLAPRLRRALQMKSDEAIGRYGTRHGAVWAVVGDLIQAGLSDDEVHTVMDTFQPALDKRDDEHGAYDVHRDVDKRLRAFERAEEAIQKGKVEDDDNPFEELTEQQLHELGEDDPLVQKELNRRRVKHEADRIEAERSFTPPPDDATWSVRQAKKRPPRKAQYLIDGLAGAKHNILITAQYKVGKTAFTLGTLAKSLCDGIPFAGEREVPKEGRVVGHWNCEMDDDELWRDYIVPADIQNEDNLVVWNLRGYRVPITTGPGKRAAVKWLKDNGIQVWTIDSLARLLRMCGVSEKENDEVLNVLMAIDEIKVEAGVDVCFMIAHTGRAEMEEGKERARGATVIDDWADSRWILTRDKDIRFMAVEGRGVGLKTVALDFNHDTKACTFGVGDKHDVRADEQIDVVVEIVAANAGITKEQLVARVKTRLKVGPAAARELINESVEVNRVRVRSVPGSSGGRKSHKHYPVIEGPVEGGATIRKVDMRKVRGR